MKNSTNALKDAPATVEPATVEPAAAEPAAAEPATVEPAAEPAGNAEFNALNFTRAAIAAVVSAAPQYFVAATVAADATESNKTVTAGLKQERDAMVLKIETAYRALWAYKGDVHAVQAVALLAQALQRQAGSDKRRLQAVKRLSGVARTPDNSKIAWSWPRGRRSGEVPLPTVKIESEKTEIDRIRKILLSMPSAERFQILRVLTAETRELQEQEEIRSSALAELIG